MRTEENRGEQRVISQLLIIDNIIKSFFLSQQKQEMMCFGGKARADLYGKAPAC